MSGKHPILESFLKGRFSLLLISFALMFFVLPLVPAEKNLLDQSISIFSLVVLISCLRAIARNRIFFIFMLVLSLINVGIGSTEIFSQTDTDAFKTVVLGFRLVYYLLVFGSIMGYVLDRGPVTGDKVAGAISAYILMGVFWSVIYALFLHLEPASFSLPEQLQTESIAGVWAIYFSFTTLTTLGYGDITPQLPAVQSYAVMEAACGQVFLTVLVARLVALQIIHSQKK
jgi:voltage-gated potassium channel